jgi:hypothetical protein
VDPSLLSQSTPFEMRCVTETKDEDEEEDIFGLNTLLPCKRKQEEEQTRQVGRDAHA